MRVVLAEDLALLRDGLIRLLTAHGCDVVAAVGDAPSLAAALDDPTVDVAVVDVRLPPGFTDEGLRVAIAARARRPGLPVMVLSQHVEHLYARELLASGEGAIGYLLKERVADPADFVDAVRRVAAGGTVLDPEVVAAIMARRRASPLDRLTAREREVLALMAQGLSNAAVATALVVSEKAVAKHISSIFTKLDLPVGPDDHRRVRAVLAWLRGDGTGDGPTGGGG
ncbi:response regulator transcription factor [Cellulomonas sp. S1-8]|uniref:response regulator transcription factor n=1 Tax=Cellulomonas sp. S1-8 TaxID=2904790 RepID=UPI002242E575|nr:response regulator transcription factor [Cellulomonas sp. S1-8]UZN02589.1 response regulator transcription factor [Cellulomonas sp. S1-8]